MCTEILEVSNKNETAVCNLASVALPKYVLIPSGKVREKDKKLRKFDFRALYDVVYQATVNLNQVIDINYYPTEETSNSIVASGTPALKELNHDLLGESCPNIKHWRVCPEYPVNS